MIKIENWIKIEIFDQTDRNWLYCQNWWIESEIFFLTGPETFGAFCGDRETSWSNAGPLHPRRQRHRSIGRRLHLPDCPWKLSLQFRMPAGKRLEFRTQHPRHAVAMATSIYSIMYHRRRLTGVSSPHFLFILTFSIPFFCSN